MHRVEVAFSDESLDSAGISVKDSVSEDLGILGVQKVRCSEAYYLDLPLEGEKLAETAQKVFTDPIVQSFSIDKNLLEDFDFLIEVKLHPDVTDNLAIVTHEAIEDFLGYKVRGQVRSAKRYYITGKIPEKDAVRIAKEMLANEVIEAYTVEAKCTTEAKK